MEEVSTYEKSVNFCKTTRRNIPEDSHPVHFPTTHFFSSSSLRHIQHYRQSIRLRDLSAGLLPSDCLTKMLCAFLVFAWCGFHGWYGSGHGTQTGNEALWAADKVSSSSLWDERCAHAPLRTHILL
jgi:hypothetical protein